MYWKDELKANACAAADLLRWLPLTRAEQQAMDTLLERFPMSVTPYYLSLINWTDKDDPVRRMAIPQLGEYDLSGSFDTSGEAESTVIEGMQHKYDETVMIITTNRCAMYCRHCFRKRLVGLSDDEVARNFDAMRRYIMAHKEVTNVLVSGGDALMNSNARLGRVLGLLCDIPHLDMIRIGSRIPVVLPSRITTDDELMVILQAAMRKKQVILVTQFNHPVEVTEEATAAVRRIQSLGIPVKNQTVMLRGVNDDPAVLGLLMRKLVGIGVVPYYVFQCRPVAGVKSQFQLPLRTSYGIVQKTMAGQHGMGKAFRFCMSHVSGKLEILGPAPGGKMLFKFHEARNREDLGRILALKVDDDQGWLPEQLEQIPNTEPAAD